MKSMVSFTLAAILAGTGQAFAERPANIANTTWTIQVNRDAEPLVIDTQGGAGAPGAANCRAITGIIRGVAPIRGHYCPSTGRISFVHTNVSSGGVMRVFSGYVSDDEIGLPLYIAGTVTIFNAVFGDLGEYNFSAAQ